MCTPPGYAASLPAGSGPGATSRRPCPADAHDARNLTFGEVGDVPERDGCSHLGCERGHRMPQNVRRLLGRRDRPVERNGIGPPTLGAPLAERVAGDVHRDRVDPTGPGFHRADRAPAGQCTRERLGDALLGQIEIPDRERERANDPDVLLVVPELELGMSRALAWCLHATSTPGTGETFTRPSTPGRIRPRPPLVAAAQPARLGADRANRGRQRTSRMAARER